MLVDGGVGDGDVPCDVVDGGGLAAAASFGHKSSDSSRLLEILTSGGKIPVTISVRVLSWRRARWWRQGYAFEQGFKGESLGKIPEL